MKTIFLLMITYSPGGMEANYYKTALECRQAERAIRQEFPAYISAYCAEIPAPLNIK